MKFLFFLFLFPLWLFAQEPSHYVLGATELEGIDIYDLHHASDGSYLLATSNGLIEFDGYRFQKMDCRDMLMSSVFNLVEDSAENVFCNNLSGQIFKFNEGELKLFLNLPDSLVSADITLEIDDHNRLVISCAGLLMVDEKGKLQSLSNSGSFGPLEKLTDGSLSAYSPYHQSFFRWKNNELREDDFELINRTDEVPALLTFRDSVYAYYTNTCEVFRFKNRVGGQIFNPAAFLGKEQLFKLYRTSNALWFASSSLGVLRINAEKWPDIEGSLIFPRTFISNVIEDAERNILLGTFGKGIIVVPNERTENLVLADFDEDVISIARSDDGSLYFGTRSGKLLEKPCVGSIRLLRSEQVKSLEALYFLGKDELLIGEARGLFLNLKSGKETALNIGSIKDLERISDDEFLIASSGGAYLLNSAQQTAEKIAGLQLRHYCIGYDFRTKSMYSGTSKGLMIRDAAGNVRTVKLREKDVIVRDFLSHHGMVYAATSESGLLVFENDSLISEWNTANGVAANQLTQLAVYNELLVVVSLNGIQLLDADGKIVRTINQADGLNALKILDLEVKDDELWLVHSAGVQKIMLNNFVPTSFQPIIKLKRVLVNDSLSPSREKRSFNHDQQKFTFELSTNSLRYRNEISYMYRLEGAESEWRTVGFTDNVIEYRSLAAGTYMFKAKAICRGIESEEITYNFTIATPFYMAWRFYLLVLVGVVMLLVFWFRRRLKRQEILAQQQNELNASKLTAIQSQMNPHFIFNALNSIQSLVLKGDIDNSYTYITKFANLVRRTLNYSDKEFIDFSEEIKLIELYLTLEQLRFKEDFAFEINTNDVDDVMIPPMLIQPFIENALVHGLLHRSGSKRIKLDFELDDVLICTITDNGVGRAKAKAIKERQRSEHESFSGNAIRTRFEILQRYHKGSLGFDYEDLTENGEPAGTRVKLRIPVKRKF